jgi:hypothetical protein
LGQMFEFYRHNELLGEGVCFRVIRNYVNPQYLAYFLRRFAL